MFWTLYILAPDVWCHAVLAFALTAGAFGGLPHKKGSKAFNDVVDGLAGLAGKSVPFDACTHLECSEVT